MRKKKILNRLLNSTLRRKSLVLATPAGQAKAGTDQKEALLIRKAKARDEEAFRSLVELHKAKVYHLLLGMLRDEDQAQELTQETFVKAWKGLPSFRGDSTLWTWLYRIAYHTALDFLRKKKRQEDLVVLEETGGELPKGPENDPLELVIKRDKEEDLHQALSRLSFRQRAVLILYYFQGLSYREIAAVTRRPLGSIRADLHRGKERLRQLIIKKWGLRDAETRPRA
ncbi:MAG TPA: sigma-70 family RNA polymerase sigma factor [Firmicutes bacterium]|uniref:RNA polymerase sigma factor n=1 Tax=Capillibacterium thermochitinicola TaxID=2699427 RepID=A0A8J6I2A1_9FIRM|nr:sigma-70 family RNA polymerase sigma factor [Capillibacterium thermochitinicola]MBA2133124.1 sigma-70 family RNA polymerase sigma factor [Capillibacterium thermochitinicola]HHW11815.1 sigma-70 family RNA polymerase sigma factor [Bacillota bacterium]